jgi:hypothetical protein
MYPATLPRDKAALQRSHSAQRKTGSPAAPQEMEIRGPEIKRCLVLDKNRHIIVLGRRNKKYI